MKKEEWRSQRVRLGCWLWALMGAMLLAGEVRVSEANGFATEGGPGLIAGIVSKMVEPSAPLERLAGVGVLVEKEVWEEEGDGNGDGGAEMEPVAELATTTDNYGCYVIKEVPTGSYRLTVAAEGLKARMEWIWVDSGRSAVLDFILVKEYEEGVATIRGTVIAGEEAEQVGEPIAGAHIEVYPPSPLQGQTFSTLTDSEGRYSLNVPSGFQQVSMWSEGYEGGVKAVEAQADETVQVNFVPPAITEEPYEGE